MYLRFAGSNDLIDLEYSLQPGYPGAIAGVRFADGTELSFQQLLDVANPIPGVIVNDPTSTVADTLIGTAWFD